MSARRPPRGSAEVTPVLSRTNSLPGISEDVIKSATQRFDVEIVFKLAWTNKGLTRLTGLDKGINLVELNLTGNQIIKIEGLENTLALRRLILTSNRISALEGLSQLTRLEGLWLQDNRLTSLEALMLPQQLAPLPNLRALYLQNLDRSAANPVCRNRGYKTALLAALPNLTNLDGERSPTALNYAELAEEYEAFRANPPPPKQWVVPDVTAWLVGVNTEVQMGGMPVEASLQQRHAMVVKVIDECEMLVRVLGEGIVKLRSQIETKQAV